MTVAPCSRSWQAEAMADGRLSPKDASSFKRHSAACHECQRELRVLAALRDTGRRLPAAEPTELERRRARQELLRRANALALGARPARTSRWLLLSAAAALAALAFYLLRPVLHAPIPLETLAETPTYDVVAGPSTTWSTLERGATLRLGLASGHLEIAVNKLRAGQRFVVQLPDGELEVKGTRFVLDVDGGTTRSVRVSEGAVALTLRGRPIVVLRPGEAYSVAPEPRPADAEEAAATTPAPPPANVARPRPVRATPAPSSSSSVRLDATTPELPAFNQAMAAFGAGDYGRAEALFHAFERENPGDARVEDSTFLRAVARKRRGDTAGAEAAAREYLRKYPAGFRRREAERLLP